MAWHRRLASAVAVSATALLTTIAPLDPAYADDVRTAQWHLAYLHLAEAHQVSQGEGMIIAIVDTGVDGTQPDLAGNVLPGVDLVEPGSNGWHDTDGRGTAMASVVAGHGHGDGNADGVLGVAPRARILPVRIAAGGGKEDGTSIAAGVERAVAAGAKIIYIVGNGSGDALSQAIERAHDAGAVVVTKAGKASADATEIRPNGYSYVVSIAGVNRSGKVSTSALPGIQVALSAPAIQIPVTTLSNGFAIKSGAGYGGAVAVGAIALVWSHYPDLTNDQVVAHVEKTAIDIGAPGQDDVAGFGIVNPLSALNMAPGSPSPSPVAVAPAPSVPLSTVLWIGGGVLAGLIIGLLIAVILRVGRDKKVPLPPELIQMSGPPALGGGDNPFLTPDGNTTWSMPTAPHPTVTPPSAPPTSGEGADSATAPSQTSPAAAEDDVWRGFPADSWPEPNPGNTPPTPTGPVPLRWPGMPTPKDNGRSEDRPDR